MIRVKSVPNTGRNFLFWGCGAVRIDVPVTGAASGLRCRAGVLGFVDF